MIYPRYNRLASLFWQNYFRYIIGKDFHSYEVIDPVAIDPDRAVMVLANHVSWWDGFWINHLNNLHFQKRFHVMMLEEELKKNRFLTYSGAFSVRKQGRAVLESLDFATQLLEQPQNLLLMFPQGRIESQHCTEPTFEKGVFRILKKYQASIQVILAANLTDYLANRKPTLRAYLQEYLPDSPSFSEENLKEAFLQHQKSSRERQGSLFN